MQEKSETTIAHALGGGVGGGSNESEWVKQWLCTCVKKTEYNSLTSSAQQRPEMTKFKVLRSTWAHDGEVFFLLMGLNVVATDYVSG